MFQIGLPRILVFGAHPEDAKYHVNGLLSWYRERDFMVGIRSVTNGAPGHDTSSGDDLGRDVTQGA